MGVFVTIERVERSGGIDKDGNTTYEERWLVEWSDFNAQPPEVSVAGPLGSYLWYSPHPANADALLKKIDARQRVSEPMLWDVTFTWDTQPEDFDRFINPVDRPWHKEWGSVSNEIHDASDWSLDGTGAPAYKPYASSAGQPFDPPPSFPQYDPTLTVTFFRLSEQPDKILDYLGTVNDATYNGWSRDVARVTAYTQVREYEPKWGTSWKYTITFQLRARGWNPVQILDCGTVKLYGPDNNKIAAITDTKTGQAVTSPVPLDGNGHQLAFSPTAEMVYLDFTGYQRADFTALYS